jgi:hypothetical protein
VQRAKNHECSELAICEIVGDLETTVAPCHVQLDAPEAIQFAADRSILVGLIVNELVSMPASMHIPTVRVGRSKSEQSFRQGGSQS